jgi:hypothetical protein
MQICYIFYFAENVRKFNEEVDAKNRELIKKECLAAAAAGQSCYLLHVSIASSYE